MNSHKVNILNQFSANYPNILINGDYKPDIFQLGAELNSKLPTITIVGTRRPTNYGQTVVKEIIESLSDYQVQTLSGLALGIDGMVHRLSIENKLCTVAVIPTDVAHIYPRSHLNLASNILSSGGSILSLQSKLSSPRKEHFHMRNQLIAGLSDVIIVIEAAERSGTMITVRHGLDMGKTILVVPGRITDPMSRGTNKLIGQGALPLTSVQDVLSQLQIKPIKREVNLSERQIKIIKKVEQGVSSLDSLNKELDMSASELSSILMELELCGAISIVAGDIYVK